MSRRFLAFLITIFIIVLLALVGVGITYVLRVTGIDSEIKRQCTISDSCPLYFLKNWG